MCSCRAGAHARVSQKRQSAPTARLSPSVGTYCLRPLSGSTPRSHASHTARCLCGALLTSVALRQIEYVTVVRTCQSVIQPLQERALSVERRHTTVIDGGEHGRTDQNLAACVTLSFGLTDACGKTDTLGPQARQALIECLNSCVPLRGL